MKIPLLEHELKFVSTAEPNFSNNKWNFTINTYNKKFIPLYSQLIIYIRQNNAESIAVCENDHTNTNDLTKFLCESQYENQLSNDLIIQIIKEKKLGKANWEGLQDIEIIKLDNEAKAIIYKSAYDLKIDRHNKWEFTIETTRNDLGSREKAQINVQVNDQDYIANCTTNANLKLLCKIDKIAEESDRIRLIDNSLPKSKLLWINIPDIVDLNGPSNGGQGNNENENESSNNGQTDKENENESLNNGPADKENENESSKNGTTDLENGCIILNINYLLLLFILLFI